MSLTPLQRRVGHILAVRRRGLVDSYVAGGVALNHALGAPRVSRDLDIFHDSQEAVQVSSTLDRESLKNAGVTVESKRDVPGFVQVLVSDGVDKLLVEWVNDSVFRFFPLQADETFGLVLHPLDLATNKVLALVGRVAVRDWVDILTCHSQLQPLGYLAWAASGKDPGLSPLFILEEAARTARYSADEVAELAFDGPPPDAAALSRTWRSALGEARQIIEELPPELVGQCVLDVAGRPFLGGKESIKAALLSGDIVFHEGRIRGALPKIRPVLETQ